MGIRENITKYISENRGSKAADTMTLLIRKKFVTNFEIMLKTKSTNPQKIIETLRKRFGYNFILDEFIETTKTIYRKGKPIKSTERYKKYYLDFEGI